MIWSAALGTKHSVDKQNSPRVRGRGRGRSVLPGPCSVHPGHGDECLTSRVSRVPHVPLSGAVLSLEGGPVTKQILTCSSAPWLLPEGCDWGRTYVSVSSLARSGQRGICPTAVSSPCGPGASCMPVRLPCGCGSVLTPGASSCLVTIHPSPAPVGSAGGHEAGPWVCASGRTNYTLSPRCIVTLWLRE